MTNGSKILSASAANFDPIGVSGESVFMASNQILTLIERELGHDVASVLATPLRDDNQQYIHWYSSLVGDSTNLGSLSPALAGPIREKLKAKLGAIAGLAAKLSESSSGSALTYAQLLQAAVRYPDETNVLVIGGEPVVTFWGFQLANIASAVSFSTVQKPVTHAHDLSGVGPKKTFWERFGWWLLLLLLILSALWLAGLRGCSADFPLIDKGTVAPSQPPIPAPVAPKLTEENLRKRDLSVFKGSWELTSGAVNSRTKEPINIDLIFNNDGVGTATVTELSSGIRCSGSARAVIDSGTSFKLGFEALRCADGHFYTSHSGPCNLVAGGELAECSVTNSDASNTFDGTFKRKN